MLNIKKGVDKVILLKAIGICALGWLAVPVIYIILKKKDDRNITDDGDSGSTDIHRLKNGGDK